MLSSDPKGDNEEMLRRLASSVFIAFVFFTTVLMFSFLSSPRSVDALPSKDYESLETFTSAISLIIENYAEEVEVQSLVYDAIDGMLKGLDPHSSFMDPSAYKEMQVETKGVFGGIGIEIGMRDGILTVIAPIEDTPASKAGLKAKDQIIKIEDKFTKEIGIGGAVKLMRGEPGTDVTIWIMRKGFKELKDFKLTRARIKVKSVKWRNLDDGYGYLRLTQFQEKSSDDMDIALKDLTDKNNGELRGLVLDLRNNPGGLLPQAVAVTNKFISSGLIVYTKGRVLGQDMEFKADRYKTVADYPIVVLVNAGSASASEIVAGALQDHGRAVIIGEGTFGKGSVQTIIPLEDGSAVRLTTSKYYTPVGRSIQAKGIVPDVIVKGEESNNGYGIKEKDLKGHLEAEGVIKEETPEIKEPESDKEKKDVEEKKVESGSEDEEPVDIQLEKAVEYLDLWYKEKGLSRKKS